jgi:hypothetical protein
MTQVAIFVALAVLFSSLTLYHARRQNKPRDEQP